MIYPTFHYNEPQNILAIELIDTISGEECFVFEVAEINEDPDALIEYMIFFYYLLEGFFNNNEFIF